MQAKESLRGDSNLCLIYFLQSSNESCILGLLAAAAANSIGLCLFAHADFHLGKRPELSIGNKTQVR